MKTKLKKGYTTGVHASFAFKSALQAFLSTDELSISKTNKMDNDDLDVTKGCEIIVCISDTKDNLTINKIDHQPYILHNKSSSLELYAGIGVGVVTKNGLKPPRNHPAINPTPLKALDNIFKNCKTNKTIYASISVTNGQHLAKQTANEKVGIFGGISILGTTGFVKPISATAYINSIAQELNYAKANNYTSIIFTLGNTAYKKALTFNGNNYIIEIGNFIYDGIALALEFDHIYLILGIAKSTKIAQGFKNTHNRFGSIDFKEVQKWCKIDITECLTIKGVRELLGTQKNDFDKLIVQKTQKQLQKWFHKKIQIVIV